MSELEPRLRQVLLKAPLRLILCPRRATSWIPRRSVPVHFGRWSISRNFDQRGFVRADDLFPSQPGRPIPDLVEVLDPNGAVIAYWGNRVGWIDKDTVEAPGFDFAAYRATQNHDAPPKPPFRG